MPESPPQNGRNGGWVQQKALPWAVVGGLGLGGAGTVTGVSQWQWIDENRPQFERNIAEISTLKERVEQLQQHNAYQDAQIVKLHDEKMDSEVWKDRRDHAEQLLRELSERFNLLEKQLDIVQDRLRSDNTR